jgi:hypothetical protein
MNPLTVYPCHPSAPDTYYINGAWAPAAVTAVEKRFSDAELAAEAWAAQCNRRVRNYDPTQDIPGVTWEWEHNIMARFATLDHHDEDPL